MAIIRSYSIFKNHGGKCGKVGFSTLHPLPMFKTLIIIIKTYWAKNDVKQNVS